MAYKPSGFLAKRGAGGSTQQLTLLVLSSLLLACPSGSALRGFTPADSKRASEIHSTMHQSAARLTSYGEPVAQLLVKNTSVDHFGSVRLPQA